MRTLVPTAYNSVYTFAVQTKTEWVLKRFNTGRDRQYFDSHTAPVCVQHIVHIRGTKVGVGTVLLRTRQRGSRCAHWSRPHTTKFRTEEAHASRDHTLAVPLWEGCGESRRCSRDTYSKSYITNHTSIRMLPRTRPTGSRCAHWSRPQRTLAVQT